MITCALYNVSGWNVKYWSNGRLGYLTNDSGLSLKPNN